MSATEQSFESGNTGNSAGDPTWTQPHHKGTFAGKSEATKVPLKRSQPLSYFQKIMRKPFDTFP